MGKKCMVDMDGVLVDFICYVIRKYAGNESLLIEQEDYPLSTAVENYVAAPFKDAIYVGWTPDDWVKMRKLPWADRLLDCFEKIFDKENVYLCTSPELDDAEAYATTVAGKKKWVEINYPDYVNKLLIVPDKVLYASPDKILFDDMDDNVNGFIKNGGKAVLVPNYWNSEYQVLLQYKDEGVYGEKASSAVVDYVLLRCLETLALEG